jgi:hypothetical protein
MPNSAFSGSVGGGSGGGTHFLWKDIVEDYGAKGDGITAADTAFVNFNSWARSQTGGVRLVIPPGSYKLTGTPGRSFSVGVKKLLVDGYGATLDSIYLGTGFYQDNLHSGLVQTVAPGSSTVTLVNLSDASRFAAGNWILITNFDMQATGFPVNALIFEYHQIQSINTGTGVITLQKLLLNNYLSTLPSYTEGSGSVMPSPGPARIYLMQPDWDRELIIKGVNFTQATDIFGTCRSMRFEDVSFAAVPDPTAAPEIIFRNIKSATTTTQMEVDKMINNLVLDNLDHRIVLVQSSSVEKMEIRRSKILTLTGTAKHNVIENSDIEKFQLGTLGFGATYSTIINNCRMVEFASVNNPHAIAAANIVNGRLTMSKFQYAGFGTDAKDNNLILGQVYFLAERLPFRITNVTDNNDPNVTVTDGIFNSSTTIQTAASGPFLPTDVGLFLKNTAGVQNSTKIVTYVSANEVTVNLPTTTTGTGKTITINRNLLFFDTTLPATILIPGGGWNARPHPCLEITVRGCAGRDIAQNLRNLNSAPAGKPYGTYALYRASTGTWAFDASELWGRVTKCRINVHRAYTGTRPTLFGGFGQFGVNIYQSENDAVALFKYNPCVNLKIVGERVMIPGTTTGTQTGDALLDFTDLWVPATWIGPWMKTTTTGALVNLSTENQTTWPIVEIEIFTDQGPVVTASTT